MCIHVIGHYLMEKCALRLRSSVHLDQHLTRGSFHVILQSGITVVHICSPSLYTHQHPILFWIYHFSLCFIPFSDVNIIQLIETRYALFQVELQPNKIQIYIPAHAECPTWSCRKNFFFFYYHYPLFLWKWLEILNNWGIDATHQMTLLLSTSQIYSIYLPLY